LWKLVAQLDLSWLGNRADGISEMGDIMEHTKILFFLIGRANESVLAFSCRKYQFMELNLQRRMTGLKEKIPDIKKTLDTVRFLKLRKVIDSEYANDELRRD
jgi:hypothetical protein